MLYYENIRQYYGNPWLKNVAIDQKKYCRFSYSTRTDVVEETAAQSNTKTQPTNSVNSPNASQNLEKSNTQQGKNQKSQTKSVSSTTKRIRKRNPDGSFEEFVSNKHETKRTITHDGRAIETVSCEESTQHKDVHTNNNTRAIREQRTDRLHTAISFTNGNNVRESDENIDLKTTERRVKEHLDSNGNVQRTEEDYKEPIANSDKDKSSTAKSNRKTHNKSNKSKEINNNNNNNQIKDNANSTNLDLLSVGNPTPRELEWRKAQLTPYALVIHESRLLPAVLGTKDSEEEANKTWTRKVSSFVKRFSRRIRTKVIGDQSIEEITDNMKIKYKEVQERIDNSQDPHLVALRNLLDRVSMQTEQSRAMDTLREVVDDFWTEDFLPEFQERIWPIICSAYLKDDIDYLSKICVGDALVFCRTIIEQRKQMNRQLSHQILWYDAVELVDTKLSKDRRPQLIVTASVHTVDCVYDRTTKEIVEGSESLIANNMFYLILEPNVDENYLKNTGHPWQIRLLQTSKQKQLV